MPENVKTSAAPLICIVDDDAFMADSIRYLVSSFGFRAEAFSSAQDFLSSSLVEETRCLILDVRMPGMDGLELQRYLANANRRIPIVFVTARANDSERRQAIAEGAVDFLRKPFSQESLLRAVRSALTNQEGGT